jgi:hypothetical protein
MENLSYWLWRGVRKDKELTGQYYINEVDWNKYLIKTRDVRFYG